MSNQPRSQRYRIGYALTPKKEQTFIQPSLLAHTSRHGIDLIRIDLSKPLIEQGPFHCIIHKVYGQDWILQLQHFSSQNPTVPIIDSPQSIETLHNRISMLEVVTQLRLASQNDAEFGVPKQVEVPDKELLLHDNAIGEMKLSFPVIAKPVMADGAANSHELCLVFDDEGLRKLTPPIVLQEFVNHGGVVFKVYVVDSHVKCVKRKSLPDISEEKVKSLKGSLSFSQISNLNASEKNKEGYCGDEVNLERVEMPSESFVVGLATALRAKLGLNFFNFDLIRDGRCHRNRYLVIDINYFPGFAKMPDYESVLTDFLSNLVKKKSLDGVTGGDG